MKMKCILPVGFRVSVTARTVGTTMRIVKSNKPPPAISKPRDGVYHLDLIFK